MRNLLVIVDVQEDTQVLKPGYFPKNFIQQLINYSSEFESSITLEFGGKTQKDLQQKLRRNLNMRKLSPDGSSKIISSFKGYYPNSITLVGCYLGCCVIKTALGLLKACLCGSIPKNIEIIINQKLCDLISLDGDRSYILNLLGQAYKYDNFSMIMDDQLAQYISTYAHVA